jgi:hypothetical protein
MSLSKSPLSIRRRTILKALGLGTLAGVTGGCDAVGSTFGRMFAIPARDTTYFTPNSKFYVVNYADGAVSMSRDLNIEQWKLHVKGAVNAPLSLGWRDILNRDSYDQVSTLMCIDTLPGGDSMGNGAAFRSKSCSKTPAPMKTPRATWSSVASMATTTAFRSSELCKTM